jgi:murein DD-endopeptidase MepM/ murein hydrolase activator NlpD
VAVAALAVPALAASGTASGPSGGAAAPPESQLAAAPEPKPLEARRLTARSLAPAGASAFPIAARHRYGTGTNRFGGGRGHGGQDVFARCGAPLVALRDARVQVAGRHAAAGNYLVLQDGAGRSYAYMHLQAPPQVDEGDAVRAGQRVGRVGATGRASGCHLHFELWTAPGWYRGGAAVDPLRLLRRLDA